MLALSLDIGGTHIGCGIVRDNELLGLTSLESILPGVTVALRALLKESGATAEQCEGIAIGSPE
jgi:glucokinase